MVIEGEAGLIEQVREIGSIASQIERTASVRRSVFGGIYRASISGGASSGRDGVVTARRLFGIPFIGSADGGINSIVTLQTASRILR